MENEIPSFPFIKVSNSSNIDGYQYNPETEELLVIFKPYRGYVYRSVPIDTYSELCAAESKGKFINSNIKNVYQFERLSSVE
jgi:hypothetical protein